MANYPYFGYYQPQQQPLQQQMPQPTMQPTIPQQTIPQPMNQSSQGLIWVQGEAGAKSYLVAPSNSVLLMDSEDSVFYIKSVDNAGMPMPLRIFDYAERNTAQVQKNPINTEQATTIDEESIMREINDLKAKYEELAKSITSKSRKPVRKESDDDGESFI